jgi:biopolymer transport protein ExbB/TolQ
MNPLLQLIGKGGPAIIAIISLSIVLYSRCFKLLLSLRRSRRQFRNSESSARLAPAEARRMQGEVRASFRQQRLALAAMIAAAPLLGLLGTVSGMVKTFESLSTKAANKSMEGLARGISEVLVSTESGLLVALPALLLVWVAHREMSALVRQLNSAGEPAAEAQR